MRPGRHEPRPPEKAAALREIAAERILVNDGPYGAMIQSYRLDEEGYRGGRDVHARPEGQQRHPEPDAARHRGRDLHDAYFDAGADIVATNTFNANAISQADYGIAGSWCARSTSPARRITRACADAATAKEPAKPRFVAGAIGPTNKTLSMSPDVNDPGYRAVDFDEVEGHLSRAGRRRCSTAASTSS